jgi:ketosteroid isomerase-like protein
MTRGDSVARRGQVEGGSALLDADVIYLRASHLAVHGRDAVRAMFTARSPGTSWEPLGGGVSYDLRFAYTFGVAARLREREQGEVPVLFEQYVAVWRREVGRPWRIVAYVEVGGAPELRNVLAVDVTPPPQPKLSGRAAEAVSRVRAADSLFADLNDRMGLSFAFSNTVAPNGALFGRGRLLVGPEPVREDYDARALGTSLSWRPVYTAVSGSLDLGFTTGEYVSTGRGPSGAAVQRFGKYLTVWGLQGDHTWKFLIYGNNQTR